MAIRLRRVEGMLIACCAARTVWKPGDVYLDDAAHHALSQKFAADFASEGLMTLGQLDGHAATREREEANNPARRLWDQTYGATTDVGMDIPGGGAT
jgi:hypothetical protein